MVLEASLLSVENSEQEQKALYLSRMAMLTMLNKNQDGFMYNLSTRLDNKTYMVVKKLETTTDCKSTEFKYCIHTVYCKDKPDGITEAHLFSSQGDFSIEELHSIYKRRSNESNTYLYLSTNIQLDKDLSRTKIKWVPHHMDEDIFGFEDCALPEKPALYKLQLVPTMNDTDLKETNDGMECFLKKIVFIVNTPGIEKLEEILKGKLSNMMHLQDTNFDSASITNRIFCWIEREFLLTETWLSLNIVKKIWCQITHLHALTLDYLSDVQYIHQVKIRPLTTLDSKLESFLSSSSEENLLHVTTIFPEATAARVFFQLKTLGCRNYLALSSKKLRKYSEVSAIVKCGILQLLVIVCEDHSFIQVYRKLDLGTLARGSKLIIVSDKAVDECEPQNFRFYPSAQVSEVINKLEVEDEPLSLSKYKPNCIQMNMKLKRIRLEYFIRLMESHVKGVADQIDLVLLQEVKEIHIHLLRTSLGVQYNIIVNYIEDNNAKLRYHGFTVILVHRSLHSQPIFPALSTSSPKLFAGVQLISYPEPTVVFCQPDDRDKNNLLDSLTPEILNTFKIILCSNAVSYTEDRLQRHEFPCANLTINSYGYAIEDLQIEQEEVNNEVSYVSFRFCITPP